MEFEIPYWATTGWHYNENYLPPLEECTGETVVSPAPPCYEAPPPISAVPLPAAGYLFAMLLVGLVCVARRKK